MSFRPDVTVAAVVERDGLFLVVEEHAATRRVLNQPAGHLEEGESLLEAVVRETLEETAYHFTPQALVGVYLWRSPEAGRTFLRVAISGEVTGPDPTRRLDRCIIRSAWLSRAQLAARGSALRSPLVLRCIDDHLAGACHPLALLAHVEQGPVASLAQVP